jgi:Cell division protein
MNDLQLALLVLGIVIIFGVIAFNWWQERKFRNETNRRFGTPKGDALLNDEFDFDPGKILKEEAQPQRPMQPEDEFEETAVVITRVKPAEPEPEPPVSTRSEVPQAERFEPELEASVDAQNHAIQHSGELEEDINANRSEPPTRSEPAAEEAPRTETTEASEPLAATERAPVALSAENDLLVDLVALLELPEAVTGNSLREFMAAVADIDKPKAVHGLDTGGIWRLIGPQEDATAFSMATCRLQLADRAGFVSQNMLNRFQHEVERMAARVGSGLTWQPEGDAWQMANELDQFCIDVDQMVGFHLVQSGNGPFTGTKFRGLAEANGLVLGTDGGFHCTNEEGLRLFSVVNRDNNPFSAEMLRTSVIYGITFQLDIPRVKSCLETFNQMVLTARQMEKSLTANLVDDHQRILDEAQIEKIRQQLKVIQAKMLTRGIIPGSPTALRLFS